MGYSERTDVYLKEAHDMLPSRESGALPARHLLAIMGRTVPSINQYPLIYIARSPIASHSTKNARSGWSKAAEYRLGIIPPS